MNRFKKLIYIVVLIGFLVIIRGVVAPYFYDPLRTFFLGDYLTKELPEINFGLYFLNIFLRYLLNTIVSLLLIYVIFEDRNTVEFSKKFYIFSFVILSIMLGVLLNVSDTETGYGLLFYVRRFLIHPIFVLVLIPAFYYQKLQLTKEQGNFKS